MKETILTHAISVLSTVVLTVSLVVVYIDHHDSSVHDMVLAELAVHEKAENLRRLEGFQQHQATINQLREQVTTLEFTTERKLSLYSERLDGIGCKR